MHTHILLVEKNDRILWPEIKYVTNLNWRCWCRVKNNDEKFTQIMYKKMLLSKFFRPLNWTQTNSTHTSARVTSGTTTWELTHTHRLDGLIRNVNICRAESLRHLVSYTYTMMHWVIGVTHAREWISGTDAWVTFKILWKHAKTLANYLSGNKIKMK